MRTYELAKFANFRFGNKIFLHVHTIAESRHPIGCSIYFPLLRQEISIYNLTNLWYLNNILGIAFFIVSQLLNLYVPKISEG